MDASAAASLARDRDRSRSPPRCLTPKRELKLIHITKCAGKSLEDWGGQRGYAWGRLWKAIKEAWAKGLVPPQEGRMKSEPWHLPPRFFRESPYTDFDTFVVVRDPYERAISEFRCPWKGFEAPTGSSQARKTRRAAALPEQLNEWLQRKLRGGVAQPPFRNGHFIPQHMYLFDARGQHTVPPENILRMERLDTDFADLLRRYGLQSSLLGRSNESQVPRFSCKDLTVETRRLIEEAYAEDFKLLSYQSHHPCIAS